MVRSAVATNYKAVRRGAARKGLSMSIKRCSWCEVDDVYREYHDNEWGNPVHDDRTLFEFLILEGAQAGLSWHTVLRKREEYKHCFDNFDVQKVAAYDEQKVALLLENPGIIRNRLKVNAAVKNAKAFIAVQKEFGSFDAYIWGFVGGAPLVHHRTSLKEIPARTEISDAMSKDLKKRGFTFVGSTIMYAFMQACGLVNDHVADCWKQQ